MKFELPPLPYSKDALEPYISAKTLEFHYEKHHKGYMNKLESMIQRGGETFSLEEIIKNTSEDDTKTPVFNNAAQVWNHTFYWNSMKKNGGGKPTGIVLSKIEESFGSYEKFAEEFKDWAVSHFGSGWVWLVLDKLEEKLKILKTSNADNVLSSEILVPLLTLDVWEHAYYLDYQNNRALYIDNFIQHLINWDFVTKNLKL